MSSNSKLPSLTIFFPFYNDEGTVEKLINDAYKYGNSVSNKLEVIAIIGGKSKDNTEEEIYKIAKMHKDLVIVDKRDNWEGYAVIKYGFEKASMDWVFYTDGDAQYHLEDLPKLVEKHFETNADVVNGYKLKRGDNFLRFFLGDMYARLSRFIFELPIRDTDCDFRLIKRSFIKKFDLLSTDSSILGELIKKLEFAEAKFAEVPVSHYKRIYGVSNYTPFNLFKEKLIGDFKLYFKLKKIIPLTRGLRIIKFGIVGLSSIFVQFFFFNILLIKYSFNPAVGTIVADQFAILTSFILNNYFTFKDKKHTKLRPVLKAFSRFYVIVMSTTIIQAMIVFIGTYFFGTGVFVSNLFFLLGIIITFFLNYKYQKNLVWSN